MVERSRDVGRLGADLLDWSDLTRNRWVIDYHGGPAPEGAVAKPDQENSDGETAA